jgi:hypothetical protein
MMRFLLSLFFIVFLALTVGAESICPLCEMHFDEHSELIGHVSSRHPLRKRNAGRLSSKKTDDLNILMPLTLQLYKNPDLEFVVDYPRTQRIWEEPLFERCELDWVHQEITAFTNIGTKKYQGCGSSLLLAAVEMKQIEAINLILDTTENLTDLANLDMKNLQNKNALVLAREILDSQDFGSKNYESWQEIIDKMERVFRFPIFSGGRMFSPFPDFVWPAPKKKVERDELDWGYRDKWEADLFITGKHTSWWGYCSGL